jgi:hypothetical protein
MAQQYPSILSLPTMPLPLTDRSATYLRETVKGVEIEIERMAEAEKRYLAEAAACKAVQELLTTTRDTYTRQLGDHAAPAVQPQRWPVDPNMSVGEAEETCPPCGQPMRWTEGYGFVHTVDGCWVVAGEWCAQAAPAETALMPSVDDAP